MGTNFYLQDSEEHVGKRSAAGYYCWDCHITLCKQGNESVHESKSEWFNHCPKCGKSIIKEELDESAAGRELGFNKSIPKKKEGVLSCSSFSWAIEPHSLMKKIKDLKEYKDKKYIKNEYDDLFTIEEFNQILEECPIQYMHSIGIEFS